MAVTAPLDDPQAALRKRLLARGAAAGPAGGAPELETPLPPVVNPAPAVAAPGPVQPAVPAGVPRTTAPTAPAAPAPAQAVTGDQPWLNWINSAYGQSKSRGTGFADLPQGTTLEQAIARYNQETGANAKYLGGPSGDRVDFGQGATDALTSGGQLWSDYGAMSGAPRAGASGVGGAAGGVGGVGAAGGAGGAGGNDFQAQTRALLLERLKQAGSPLDPNGGGIGEAMAGARLEADRASQMERTALAERRAASGDTSGSLQQGIQQSAERNAVGLGSLRATLIQKEYAAKRQEMENLLQLATASGDAQAARDVQVQLANLDATVRREGLGLDAAKYTAYLNQDAAKAGLNG